MPEGVGEGELSEQWKHFKCKFTLFMTAIGKGTADSKDKLAMLLRVVGQRVNDMYEGMIFGEGEDKKDFEMVVAKLDSLCVRRTSKHVLQEKLFQLEQEGQTIDPFVGVLRKHIKDCDFGTLKDDLMLHVLIRGIDSDQIRCRLFETDKLELTKAVPMCQAMEATSAHLQS